MRGGLKLVIAVKGKSNLQIPLSVDSKEPKMVMPYTIHLKSRFWTFPKFLSATTLGLLKLIFLTENFGSFFDGELFSFILPH